MRSSVACRAADEAGEEKTILFNLSGHGHFDMAAYDNYFEASWRTWHSTRPRSSALAAIEGLPTPILAPRISADTGLRGSRRRPPHAQPRTVAAVRRWAAPVVCARRGSVLLAGASKIEVLSRIWNRTKPRSAPSCRTWRKSEELRSFGDRRIAELQQPDRRDRQRRDAAVEERVVRPQRLVDRPPADPGSAGVAVDVERLRLRDRPVARRNPARAETAPELGRVVEVDEPESSGSSSAASASCRRRRMSTARSAAGRGTVRAARRFPRPHGRSGRGSRRRRGCRAGRRPRSRGARAASRADRPARARSRRSSGGGSGERVRALGTDRPHQLLGLPRSDEVDRPPVAEQRVDAPKPGAGRLRLVDTKQVRPDELEQVDLLGVERVDPRTLEPARDPRAAHAEDLGKRRLRAEVDASASTYALRPWHDYPA